MMTGIDFTDMPKRNKTYAGANGSKIAIIYENKQYMLKFPSLPMKNKDMSYSNSCFSEYLGSKIYESAGIPVQETLLGPGAKSQRESVLKKLEDIQRKTDERQDRERKIPEKNKCQQQL